MIKALWLMDVDGVLNAVGARPPRLAGHWTEWKRTRANAYSIQYSPQLIARVQGLVDEGLVEVQWLTTWWNEIGHLPFTGWHHWTVANSKEEFLDNIGGAWWKLPVAQRVYEPGRKMVWTDDDLRTDAEALDWVDANKPYVLDVAPQPTLGLTPEHLDTIERFLRA